MHKYYIIQYNKQYIGCILLYGFIFIYICADYVRWLDLSIILTNYKIQYNLLNILRL